MHVYKADTLINCYPVTHASDDFEYQSGILAHKILDEFEETEITRIELGWPGMEASVLNETFATFAQLNIPKTGLDEFKLEGVYDLEERLDETVIDQFAVHCKSLIRLSICNMKTKLPKPVYLQVVELATLLVESQEDSRMEELDFTRMSQEDAEEPVEEEIRLLTSLLDSPITMIKFLHFRGNKEWFANAETAGYLCEFIEGQKQLW